MRDYRYCINCFLDSIRDNLKDKRQYLINFFFIGFIFIFIKNLFGFDWAGNVGVAILSAAVITSIWAAAGGDPISKQIKKLEETIDTAGVIKKTGLFSFKEKIEGQGDSDFWYNHIRDANGDISLMSPSLRSWFELNPQQMERYLVYQALQERKIRLVIMDGENHSCNNIISE